MSLGTTNITTTLVGTTIGSASRDVGTLCSSPLINKWSRWKPIQYTGDVVTDSILVANNFGLYVNSNTNYQTAAAMLWGYTKPTSKYRIGDFRNYDSAATSPIRIGSDIQNLDLNKNTQISYTLMYLYSLSGGTSIGLDELSSIQNLYLGIIIVDGSGNTYPITSTQTIANSGVSISIDLTAAPFASIPLGTSAYFTLYHLLFTSPRVQGDALGTNTYYPLPTTSNVVTTLTVSNTFSLDVSITRMAKQLAPPFSFVDMNPHYDGGQGGTLYYENGVLIGSTYFTTTSAIYFEVIFTNNSGSSQTINISLLGLYMSRTLKRSTSYTETPPTVYNTGTFTVANGSSVTLYIGSMNGLRYDSTNALQTLSSSDQASISFQLRYNGNSIYSIPPLLLRGQ